MLHRVSPGHSARGIRGPIETRQSPVYELEIHQVTARAEFAAPLRQALAHRSRLVDGVVTARAEFAAPLRQALAHRSRLVDGVVTARAEFAAPLRLRSKLELDHSTDARWRKLGIYRGSGFPEIWVWCRGSRRRARRGPRFMSGAGTDTGMRQRARLFPGGSNAPMNPGTSIGRVGVARQSAMISIWCGSKTSPKRAETPPFGFPAMRRILARSRAM